MAWVNLFVLYALIWWTLLFAVLPLGTKPVAEADPTTGWRGTPARPQMGRKVVITTLVSAVVWMGIVALFRSDWMGLRSGWLAMTSY